MLLRVSCVTILQRSLVLLIIVYRLRLTIWVSGFRLLWIREIAFLKIVSYILANKIVDGKPAVDYFDDKIDDQMILNEMHAAAAANNDVILFNIDAKAKDTVGSDKQSILKVFYAGLQRNARIY